MPAFSVFWVARAVPFRDLCSLYILWANFATPGCIMGRQGRSIGRLRARKVGNYPGSGSDCGLAEFVSALLHKYPRVCFFLSTFAPARGSGKKKRKKDRNDSKASHMLIVNESLTPAFSCVFILPMVDVSRVSDPSRWISGDFPFRVS